MAERRPKPAKRGVTWVDQDGRRIELPFTSYSDARAAVGFVCDQATIRIQDLEKEFGKPAPNLHKRVRDARRGLNHLVKALKGAG